MSKNRAEAHLTDLIVLDFFRTIPIRPYWFNKQIYYLLSRKNHNLLASCATFRTGSPVNPAAHLVPREPNIGAIKNDRC